MCLLAWYASVADSAETQEKTQVMLRQSQQQQKQQLCSKHVLKRDMFLF